MLTVGGGGGGGGGANGFSTSTLDSTKLHERPGIMSEAAAAVVTMDTDLLLWIWTWIRH